MGLWNVRGGLVWAMLAIGLSACASAPSPGLESVGPAPSPMPAVAELQQALLSELAERGIDPARHAVAVPSAGSEVIDLVPTPIDPDGAGPLTATGYLLRWTERLTGDHDQNGEVNIADLQPLANAWQQTVLYDDPLAHDGFTAYPVGNPEFDGDVAPDEAPVIGSGAYNWRLARIDSDGNGEVNLGEITSLARHFQERLAGYRVYRRAVGTSSFTRLNDPANAGQPLLVPRSSVNGGGGVDPLRPVSYQYIDNFSVDADYEYRVVPFDAASGLEGPPSLPGFGDTANLVAAISADVLQGAAPLAVNFDASSSTLQIGTISGYFWDFDGDGSYEVNTGTVPTASHTFLTAGAKRVGLGVAASGGETDTAEVLISVTLPPSAVLSVDTALREVPLTISYIASASSDSDGEVVRYLWDMDGDGSYELDAGPIGQRQVNHSTAGNFTVGVKVVDNLGASDTAELGLTLSDNYEEIENNDSALLATPLGNLPAGSLLSGLRGGIGLGSYDGDQEDWFSFDVPVGLDVSVELTFVHAAANLDLELFGSDPVLPLATATGQADGELLSGRLLKQGRYHLRVLRAFGPGGNSGEYTLGVVTSLLTLDEVEPNASAGAAQELGSIDLNLLPDFWGRLGSPASDTQDWYRFSTGLNTDFAIKLAFFHSEADLELKVYAADGQTLLGSSSSVNDDELVVVALTPGDYLVNASQFGSGSANYQLSILLP